MLSNLILQKFSAGLCVAILATFLEIQDLGNKQAFNFSLSFFVDLEMSLFSFIVVLSPVYAIAFCREKEDGGRGRFKSHSTAHARISDREKKAPLKT